MDIKLTRLQFKQIFSMYYGQKILMVSINATGLQTVDSRFLNLNSDEFKLALIPMDEMPDDVAIDLFCQMSFKRQGNNPIITHFPDGIGIINNSFEKVIYWKSMHWLEYQFLVKLGYAVPLYIELGHPANGKTAIELDLAIDRTLIKFKS